MEEIIKRLNLVKDYYKLSGSSLGRATGINITSVNCFFSGKTKVSFEFIASLLNLYPSISAEWLIRGNGNMLIEKEKSVDEELRKELEETKIKLLVQEGITKELRDIILEKNNKKGGC